MKTIFFFLIFSISLNLFSQVQTYGTENDNKIIIVTSKIIDYSNASTKVKSRIRYIYKGQSHDITKNAKSYENIIKDVPLAYKEFKKYRTKKVMGFAGSMIFLVGSVVTATTMFHGSTTDLYGNTVPSDKETNFVPMVIGAVASIPFFVIISTKEKNIIKSAEYFNSAKSNSSSLNNFELKPCIFNTFNNKFASIGITLSINL